jgi:hypothetical protein
MIFLFIGDQLWLTTTFKLFNTAIPKSLKYRYFRAEWTKFSEKVLILALNMKIFQKFGPRADLGWP